MDTLPLSRIDLNLLVVLDVLLREKSVSRTAARLNLTSSAISHTLKRLRILFDNELLVRDGRQMVPTTLALSLSEALPPLLTQMERLVSAPEPFDPTTSQRSFRLVAPDFFSSIVPRLLKIVAHEAPKVRVELVAFSDSAIWDMGRGRYDALIAPSFRQTDELRGTMIGQWPWMTFGRAEHPAFENWSLEEWAHYPHLQIGLPAPTGRSMIDRAVAGLGVERRIGAVVPHFSMAPPILQQTDMLLSVSAMSMNDMAKAYGLEKRPVPFDMKPVELMLFTSAITTDQPEIQWFRNCVASAATELLAVGE